MPRNNISHLLFYLTMLTCPSTALSSMSGPIFGVNVLPTLYARQHEQRKELIRKHAPVPTVLQRIICEYDDAAPQAGKWAEASHMQNNSWFWVPCYSSLLYLSPDRIAAGNNNGYVQIGNPVTGKLLERTKSHDQRVIALAHDKEAKQLIAGIEDGTITIYDDALNYQLIATLKSSSPLLRCLALFNKSRILLSGFGSTGSIECWNMQTRLRVTTITSQSRWTHALEPISEDQFASRGNGGYVTLWDVNTQQAIRRTNIPRMKHIDKIAYLGANTLAITNGHHIALYDSRSMNEGGRYEKIYIGRICELLNHHGTLISRYDWDKIFIHDIRKLGSRVQEINVPGQSASTLALASDPDSDAFSAAVHPGIIKTWKFASR